MSLKLTIWTVGHSTLPIEDFIRAISSFQIQVLSDVRSFPGSRRHPHFNQASLAISIATAGIDYVHCRELGGRRRAKPDSLNMTWRNETFRGYADYMETDGFRHAIQRLIELAQKRRTAVMCAEAVWWRCHRSLISDYLKAKGARVIHILGAGKSEEHPFTSAAQIVNGELSYRGVLERSGELFDNDAKG